MDDIKTMWAWMRQQYFKIAKFLRRGYMDIKNIDPIDWALYKDLNKLLLYIYYFVI